MKIRNALAPAALVLVSVLACVAPTPQGHAQAQEVVLSMASQHAEVVRLTLHAIPAGESELRVVASTLRSRLGTPSDPEDVVAFKGGLEVVLAEGDNTDVTLPIKNSAGKVVAVTGITVKGAREPGIALARNLADELARNLSKTNPPLW
ncbi:MAG: hypothetical protein NTV21_17885 [Planctomycetota bacterium]|nr:hypothetical protein [Planctomycetota bacterium]